MKKCIAICFIFVQSAIIMGAQPAEKVVKRTSDPRQSNGVPKSMPIPQKNLNRLTPERSPQSSSPWEFSPNSVKSGTVYYCGAFGALDDKDFSPVSYSSK